jgi:hypothetical protein
MAFPAVVPVLSKAFWDQDAAHDQEQQRAQGKDCRQSEKVPGIFESLHAGARDRPFTPETYPQPSGRMPPITKYRRRWTKRCVEGHAPGRAEGHK